MLKRRGPPLWAALLILLSSAAAIAQPRPAPTDPTAGNVFNWIKSGMPSVQQQQLTITSLQAAKAAQTSALTAGATTASDRGPVDPVMTVIHYDPTTGITLEGGVQLLPGECIDHHQSKYDPHTGAPAAPSDETACLPEAPGKVPLGGMAWPLAIGLAGVGLYMSRRRLGRAAIGVAFVGMVFASSDQTAEATPNLGLDNKPTLPRCDYLVEDFNLQNDFFWDDTSYDAWWLPDDGNNWWYYRFGMYHVTNYAQANTGWKWVLDTSARKWNTNWSDAILGFPVLGDSYTPRTKGTKHVKSCDIRFDPEAIHEAADFEAANFDGWNHRIPDDIFMYIVLLHEFGHCLGLGHFTLWQGETWPAIGVDNESDRVSVMNYAIYHEMDPNNPWPWIRYSPEEFAEMNANFDRRDVCPWN